jgi:hypothetical protein
MPVQKRVGSTGINVLFSDELDITSVARADMRMSDGGFLYAKLMWLLYARDVPGGIPIFLTLSCISISSPNIVGAVSGAN